MTAFTVTHPNSLDISPDSRMQTADAVSCEIRGCPHFPRAVPQAVDGDGEGVSEVGRGTDFTFWYRFNVDNGHLAWIEL